MWFGGFNWGLGVGLLVGVSWTCGWSGRCSSMYEVIG